MFKYFLERARGWRVIAHVLAPVVWFQAALLMTSIYASYIAAQGARPLEETPFFSEDVAAARFASIVAAGQEQLALVFYGLDTVNAVLLGAGLAAVIGFGLRALGQRGLLARAALTVPLALVVADLLENALLAVGIAAPGYREAIGGVAGVATGGKFLFFAAAALLAAIALVVGLCAWALRLLRRRS